jgi:hypothetical protein
MQSSLRNAVPWQDPSWGQAMPAAGPGWVAGLHLRLWALTLPITSVLLAPSIQGTTPGYLLTLMLLLPWVGAVVLQHQASRFYAELGLWLMFLVGFTAAGQLLLAITDPLDTLTFFRLSLMDRNDPAMVLRNSMFTQGLYLLAAITAFVFVKLAYRPDWDRWLLGGAMLLAAYGFYESVYFLATGANGDFLSNRTFGDERTVSGSLFQALQIGPVQLLRLKSLTGEPSMYAFTILPFWIYALHTGRTKTHLVLLASLILSTSTTAIVGVAAYCLFRVVLRAGRDPLLLVGVIGALVAAALLIGGNEQIVKAYNLLVGNKLAARDVSGSERLANSLAVLQFWADLPWLQQWLGIGFGVVRSTDFFSTLLLNTGVVGLVAFIALFAWPICRLGSGELETGLRLALAVIFLTAMVSVPEFAYLSSWLFLGMAYHQLALARDPAWADTQPPQLQSAPRPAASRAAEALR